MTTRTRKPKNDASGSDPSASEPEPTADGETPGVDPLTLTTPERDQRVTTRDDAAPATIRPGRPPVDAALEELRKRMAAVRRSPTDLPGARAHCADCFTRGVRAALDALEK